MKKIILFALAVYFISCNGGGCGGAFGSSKKAFAPLDKPVARGLNMEEVIAKRGRLLPDICTMVPMHEIADILEVPEYDIYISDNNPRVPDPIHSSCFFKWTDDELSNAGIFMRAERNPYPEEFPAYLTEMIIAKKTSGERFVDESIPPNIFTDFEGIGDDGAYNTTAASYYWRLGEEIAFRLTFNTTHTPERQYELAQQLAIKVIEYYLPD